MPDCDEIIGMLSDSLDRDALSGSCSAIEAHLKSCRDCERAAASLRRTVALCRQFRVEDRPDPLPVDKRRELREALERALESMRQGRSS
jgi:predicted anti-sigma-YlaC factor YlaD